ncbi:MULTISPECIES: hypothetical protein [Prevotellaceae]|uniref:hypothetical protein n=1 Tax=Prevotellaceae TaxID=171552 RepID=UPI0003D2B913|nr:hypothetical protein [Prevotella phocaeensis]ETD17545.1 hypothetical protein HMPREF1199_01796 [Hoylesella oralis CC98A]
MDKNSKDKELLTKLSFKFLDEMLFRNRMKEVFGYDVGRHENLDVDTINAISVNDEPDFVNIEIFCNSLDLL